MSALYGAYLLFVHPRATDEATSLLDSLTEETITETICESSAREEMITILIAHRLSTVMHADRMVVL